jgi:hypothetical protein
MEERMPGCSPVTPWRVQLRFFTCGPTYCLPAKSCVTRRCHRRSSHANARQLRLTAPAASVASGERRSRMISNTSSGTSARSVAQYAGEGASARSGVGDPSAGATACVLGVESKEAIVVGSGSASMGQIKDAAS